MAHLSSKPPGLLFHLILSSLLQDTGTSTESFRSGRQNAPTHVPQESNQTHARTNLAAVKACPASFCQAEPCQKWHRGIQAKLFAAGYPNNNPPKYPEPFSIAHYALKHLRPLIPLLTSFSSTLLRQLLKFSHFDVVAGHMHKDLQDTY